MATDAPDPSRLAGLPPPVARYLQFALGDRLRAPAAVHLRQAGQLRTSPTSRRWLKFTADHTAAPGDCSFRWDARVAVAPLVHVRVSDSLAGGIGSGRVLLQSLVRIAHDAGTPEMNSGSLHRFLAEAVWYPWALLPGEHLRWQPAGEDRALATLSCQARAVSLEFRFAPSGEVSGIYTPARWGSFGGGYRQLPWEGHFADYREHGGVRVPARGEVGWHWEGRLELVWRGEVTAWGSE